MDLACGDIEVGKTYRGIVRGVKDFGVFVECLPGKEGFVHVSELADFRVEHPDDICKLQEEMWVKCIGVDERGRVRLSRRIAIAEREAIERGEPVPEIELPPPPPKRSRDNDGDRRPRGGGRPPRNNRGGDRRPSR